VPFYREHARPGARLDEFPLIDRDVVQRHFSQFIAASRFPDFIVMSGGTTGHVVNATLRNEEEYDAAYRYLTGSPSGAVPGLDEIDHFGLDVYFNTNGYTRRKPKGWPLVSVPLERKAHADLITRLLTEGFELGGTVIPATYLQAQNALHRVLAGYYAVADHSPDSFQLDSVFGYGSHISRVWHERLRALWGVEVVTTYGLCEFAGANAAPCSVCGGLHYLTAWQEFLSPRDHSPVETGDAVLVLTSLIPFVTVQPRIRYVTQDLVTIVGRCPATGLVGFRFRGRERSSVVDDANGIAQVLLSEVDILEALDQLDGVHAHRHPSEIQLWDDGSLRRPPFRMGLPLYDIDGSRFAGDGIIRIRVAVAFDPAAEPVSGRRFEAALLELLHEETPALSERVQAGEARLTVELARPEQLRRPVKISA
jgi:hypothetical protein